MLVRHRGIILFHDICYACIAKVTFVTWLRGDSQLKLKAMIFFLVLLSAKLHNSSALLSDGYQKPGDTNLSGQLLKQMKEFLATAMLNY